MEDVQNLVKSTAAEMEKLLNSKTVVGEPLTVDGTTIIPLIAVGFGFGAGGGSGKPPSGGGEGSGGGTGGGGGVKPVAVIIVNADGVRVERVGNPGMVEQLGDAVAKVMRRPEPKPKE